MCCNISKDGFFHITRQGKNQQFCNSFSQLSWQCLTKIQGTSFTSEKNGNCYALVGCALQVHSSSEYIYILNTFLNLNYNTHTHLLHSMSSGQAIPNTSMSLWHSSLARWQRDRHGMDTWPYTMHTGAYRAHRNILRSALHTKFTMGWKGYGGDIGGEI